MLDLSFVFVCDYPHLSFFDRLFNFLAKRLPSFFEKVCIEIGGRDRLGCQDQEASLLVQVKEWKLNEDNNLILIQMFE